MRNSLDHLRTHIHTGGGVGKKKRSNASVVSRDRFRDIVVVSSHGSSEHPR